MFWCVLQISGLPPQKTNGAKTERRQLSGDKSLWVWLRDSTYKAASVEEQFWWMGGKWACTWWTPKPLCGPDSTNFRKPCSCNLSYTDVPGEETAENKFAADIETNVKGHSLMFQWMFYRWHLCSNLYQKKCKISSNLSA